MKPARHRFGRLIVLALLALGCAAGPKPQPETAARVKDSAPDKIAAQRAATRPRPRARGPAVGIRSRAGDGDGTRIRRERPVARAPTSVATRRWMCGRRRRQEPRREDHPFRRFLFLQACCWSSPWSGSTSTSTRESFARAVAAADLSRGRGDEVVVTDGDIVLLPVPVQRYLHFMGVVGRCRDWSFRAHLTGSFRTKPDQAWSPMEAWQYDSRREIARIFYLNVRMFGLLPVVGRDTYLRGEGRMLIRPLDLFTVDDVKGDEVEISEVVTYLNDAILLAPSFLLGPETTWSAAGPDGFDVALTYAGHTVTAQVSIDERGAPRDFSTTDRFLQDPNRSQAQARSGALDDTDRRLADWSNGGPSPRPGGQSGTSRRGTSPTSRCALAPMTSRSTFPETVGRRSSH